ncbi:MAG: hypothetical protein JKY55_18485 [Aliivibrio sp.]|uniref:hypothetical protein n=1 Tax=Aliivibrio sp. TaxID=1872443 RepID=UPI001A5781CF|nr:hypothetical protein [Aliivibrio sp.]
MNSGSKSIIAWFLATMSSIEASGVIQVISGIIGVIAGIAACRYYIEARKAKKVERLISEEKLKYMKIESA